MGNLLGQGAAWLNDQRHKHLTQMVSYHRGVASVELGATVGRSEFEQVDDYGLVQRIESRDYLVQAADLVLNTQRTLPHAGDKIRETQGAQTFVYEVMAPGNEPPYRYSDPQRHALRIHTKLVATEDA